MTCILLRVSLEMPQKNQPFDENAVEHLSYRTELQCNTFIFPTDCFSVVDTTSILGGNNRMARSKKSYHSAYGLSSLSRVRWIDHQDIFGKLATWPIWNSSTEPGRESYSGRKLYTSHPRWYQLVSRAATRGQLLVSRWSSKC
jgi:hypothetical protein